MTSHPHRKSWGKIKMWEFFWGVGGLVGGGSAHNISFLTVLQSCQASNVGDCEFPGVCALFTDSCRPTFRGAVCTLPDIRRSLERRQSHRYDHTD